MDSAFALKQYQHHSLISSQKDPDRDNLLLLNRDAMSLRQMLKWMRMIQGQFSSIKDQMFLEEGEDRKIIMNLLINLYNFQCVTIGHNQILLTFMKTPAATTNEVLYLKVDLVEGFFHVGRTISNGAFASG